MAYTKPQVIAQNNASGSYAAGCPANQNALESNIGDKHGEAALNQCKKCERTM